MPAPTRRAYDAGERDGARASNAGVGIVLLFGLTLFAPAALCQTYPDRPIRLISPNPAGGANDTIVRIIAAKMSAILGASIVIDNRGGAGGKIGAEAVAHAAPDGYTLLAGSVSTHSFAPVVTAKLAYDPIKDFEPISLFALVQNVLVVSPALPVANVSGAGRPRQSAAGQAQLRLRRARLDQPLRGRHVRRAGRHPERHRARAVTRAARPAHGGNHRERDASSTSVRSPAWCRSSRPDRSGALAVSGDARSPALPDVPTMREAGHATDTRRSAGSA